MLVILAIAFLIIILIEVPHLWKSKMWGELAAFSVILAIGIGLAVPQTLGILLPNPIKYITAIFKPAADWLK